MVARLCDGGEGGRFCSGCSVVRRGLVRRIADPTAAPGEDECAGVDRRVAADALLRQARGRAAAFARHQAAWSMLQQILRDPKLRRAGRHAAPLTHTAEWYPTDANGTRSTQSSAA